MIKETKNLQDQIQEWAEKTFTFYIEEDKIQNKGFYTQSPLNNITESPDIIVMGINPGSEGNYKEDLDVSAFKKGNPYWDKDKGHRNWKYIQRVEDLLRKGLGDRAEEIFSDDKRIVYINASCFQTPKANALENKLLIESLRHTIGLIELLKPKLLLCLSAKRLFSIEKSFEKIELTDDIMLGSLGDIPIIGIPHPSAHLSSAKREYIRQVIALAIENSHLNLTDKAELIKKKLKFEETKTSVSIQNIFIEIVQYLKDRYEITFQESNLYRFKINEEIGITITSKGGGYIGIRHLNYTKKYSCFEYPNTDKYLSVLERFKYSTIKDMWLGTKGFKEYGNATDCIVKNILEEIEDLRKNLS